MAREMPGQTGHNELNDPVINVDDLGQGQSIVIRDIDKGTHEVLREDETEEKVTIAIRPLRVEGAADAS